MYGSRRGGQFHQGRHTGPNPWNVPLLLCLLLLPPLLFFGLLWLLTFKVHYTEPLFVWLFWGVPALAAIWFSCRLRTEPRLRAFASFMVLFTVLFAGILGQLNYWYNMYPYYFIKGMKTVSNVDVSQTTGDALMDAGKLYFKEKTHLNYTTGMSFTNYDTYCVAPIVMDGEQPVTYDFWAVGINCCTSNNPEFRCGEFHDPNVRAGIRMFSEAQRLYFALAVQQAEAAYGIRAQHPLFFYWVKDPDEEYVHLMTDGYKYFILSLGIHGALNFVFVMAFMIYTGHNRKHHRHDATPIYQVQRPVYTESHESNPNLSSI